MEKEQFTQVLLTVTALAASQWGVLDFAKRQGANSTDEDLLTLSPESWMAESDLVDIHFQEAVFQADKLYMAITCTPKRESTLVMLKTAEIKEYNITQITMNCAMKTDAYAADLTVMDYAKEQGYQRVVMMNVGESMMFIAA